MKKLNIGKVALTLSMVSAISVSSVFPALADWKQNTTGWWYEEENGSYVTNNWRLINEKWYYFGIDGYLFTDRITPDGYKVDKNGEITEKLTEKDFSTTVPTSRSENFITETTEEVTETSTTTVPETTTVAPTTEIPTTIAETTPKSTEWQPTGSWSNEEEAKAIGSEIQNSKGWSKNPVQFNNNYASFGNASAGIELRKSGSGYDLTLYVRIKNSTNQQGLQAICMLTGISGLYDTIYDAYEGSNSNGINYDTPVTIGGHTYIATNNGSNMVFHIE